jgi:hypothetical protein
MTDITNITENLSDDSAIQNLMDMEGTAGVNLDHSMDLFLGLAQEIHRRGTATVTEYAESTTDADADLFDIWRTPKTPKNNGYHLLDGTPRDESGADKDRDRMRQASEAAVITASQIDAFAKRNASNDTVSDIFNILGEGRNQDGAGGSSSIPDDDDDHTESKPRERRDITINFNNRWHVIAIGVLLGLIMIPTIIATSWLTKEVLISTLEEEYIWRDTTTVTRTVTAASWSSTGSERPGVQIGTLTLTHYLYSTATTVTTTFPGETSAMTTTGWKPVITTPATGGRGGLWGLMWIRTVEEADLVTPNGVKEDLMTSTGIVVFVTIETELSYTEQSGQKKRVSSTGRDNAF